MNLITFSIVYRIHASFFVVIINNILFFSNTRFAIPNNPLILSYRVKSTRIHCSLKGTQFYGSKLQFYAMEKHQHIVDVCFYAYEKVDLQDTWYRDTRSFEFWFRFNSFTYSLYKWFFLIAKKPKMHLHGNIKFTCLKKLERIRVYHTYFIMKKFLRTIIFIRSLIKVHAEIIFV